MTDEELIRAARATSNAAIVRKHVDTIASFWTEEVHVLGSMSLQLSGIEANRRFYEAQFARRPDTTYARTPSTVHVMAAWKVALESGDWVATWTDPDGPVRVSGSYMAQWLRSDAGWRIQGELYVPTSCAGGAYCERHPVKS
ncbi:MULTISPECIES: YybH family protein [unclassified Variovorax]|uniref:YybH family protein n=1 Tax=unclassified Variovorax TaxID=663243 RepID=UPI003F48B584